MSEQLELATTTCKYRGCSRAVVGASVIGEGHVCKGHNEREWGEALRKYDPEMSRALLADSERKVPNA